MIRSTRSTISRVKRILIISSTKRTKPSHTVSHTFILSLQLDKCYTDLSESHDIYKESVKPIVDSALEGVNGTVFMYGQTGAGKTYTMLGDYSKEVRIA